MRIWHVVLGALALVAGASALAEPTPLVSRLMNEPVSLFSLGIYRLGVEVSSNAKNAGFSYGTAGYDWDTNQIDIRAGAFSSTSSLPLCANPQACEKDLRDALNKFANHYAFKLPDGTWMQWVTGNFTPDGYEQKQFHNGKTSSQAAQELVKIVKISAMVTAQSGVTYQCRRDLQSSDVFCTATQPKKP